MTALLSSADYDKFLNVFISAHTREGPAPRTARRPADPERPLRCGLYPTQMRGAPAGL